MNNGLEQQNAGIKFKMEDDAIKHTRGNPIILQASKETVGKLLHSQAYTKSAGIAVTKAGGNLVYTWSTRSTKTRKDGTKKVKYQCAGCRSRKREDETKYKDADIPSKCAIVDQRGEMFWVQDGGNKAEHFCSPVSDDKVNAREIGRTVKHNMANGFIQNTAKPALDTIAATISNQYAHHEFDQLQEIQRAAIGKNSEAGLLALRRAQMKGRDDGKKRPQEAHDVGVKAK